MLLIKSLQRNKTAAITPAQRMSVIPLSMRGKSLFPVPVEKEHNLKEWVAKHWRDYRRVSIIPSALETNLPSVTSIERFVKDKSPPLQIQFRPDGSVIPIEEIMR